MTSAQKVIVRNWMCAGFFFLVLASTFLVPAGHRLSAGLASSFVLVLILAVNPGLRQWKGYGSRGLRLGEYLQEHGIMQLWVVGFCVLALPALIYQVYNSGGDVWGLYVLCFVLLIGPVIVTSEIERYRSAGRGHLTSSGTQAR